jgi:hypothetical protein
MRSKVNPAVTSDVCGRFVELVERHLNLSWSDVAEDLGYSNRTTLDAVRKARTLPGMDKIYLLAKLQGKDGRRANIDWLFSNEGPPLIDHATESIPVTLNSGTIKAIEKLLPEHHKAVNEIIRLFARDISEK